MDSNLPKLVRDNDEEAVIIKYGVAEKSTESKLPDSWSEREVVVVNVTSILDNVIIDSDRRLFSVADDYKTAKNKIDGPTNPYGMYSDDVAIVGITTDGKLKDTDDIIVLEKNYELN